MLVLGVSFLQDSGAVLLKDGKILSAVNEERLSRKKLFEGFPTQSIEYLLAEYNLNIDDIECVATHGLTPDLAAHKAAYDEKSDEIITSSLLRSAQKKERLDHLWKRYSHELWVINVRTADYIDEIAALGRPLKMYEHHTAHAAAAYYCSGMDDCYVATADGWGEDGSFCLYRGSAGTLEKLVTTPTFCSLGYFYGSITKHLGFVPHRHEGKILGLAATGNPEKVMPILEKMIRYNPEKGHVDGLYEEGLYIANFDNPYLAEALEGFSREDVAAATQKVLERSMIDFFNDKIKTKENLAVAGGIFANVLLNQRLVDHTNIDTLFIFPNMGDGGLAMGCALLAENEESGLRPFTLDGAYWGMEYTNEQIEEALGQYELEGVYHDDIESEIGRLLADKKVVARFNGRMEYGPRALGNRSILYHPNDATVNDWLNQKLKRTEFMPFAPVTLEEDADRCYKNVSRYGENARYMTITMECTDFMKETACGCVHVDNTARPQLVNEAYNKSYYQILKKFKELTGIPTLINTSFNMHEEPIVSSPQSACKAFVEGSLDCLAIGNYLVINKW